MKAIKRFITGLWSNRPFRTFIQSFFGVLAGASIMDLENVNTLKAVVISAIAAGISAVMSLEYRSSEENE